MKKIIALITLLASVFSLVACADTTGLPEGMQLVRGGEEYGYYFYSPEEWTVANV